MTDSAVAASAASSNPLSPPPITPLGGTPAFAAAAASSAMAASSAAGAGPSPPPVVSTPASSSQRSVSTSAVSVSGGSNGGAGALTASGAFSDASAEAGAVETAEGGPAGGKLSDGMQFLAAVVGCAAVGTVMWSEFVLKDTGGCAGCVPVSPLPRGFGRPPRFQGLCNVGVCRTSFLTTCLSMLNRPALLFMWFWVGSVLTGAGCAELCRAVLLQVAACPLAPLACWALRRA